MDKVPLFSVCIPTYNRAHLLSAAIDSVLAQDFEDYELVIVDNASTDHTQEVLKRYHDPRIRFFRNSNTVSMYANHNKCIEFARAEWIVFLHSDDQFPRGVLSVVYRLCNSQNRPDVITSTCSYYLPLWQSMNSAESFLLEGGSGLILLFRYMGLNMPGACFARKVLIDLRGFDEESVIADYDLYVRLLRNENKILITRDSLVQLGTTERATSRLIQNKEWIFEQGVVVARHASHPNCLNLLIGTVSNWQPAEVARLLMYLAAGNAAKTIAAIEKTGLPIISEAKKDKNYRHVLIFKLLGHRGHRMTLKILAYLQGIRQKVAWNY